MADEKILEHKFYVHILGRDVHTYIVKVKQLGLPGFQGSSQCTRCGKNLTNQISVEANMGPICRSKSKVRGDQVIDVGEFGDTGLDEKISFFDSLVLKREDGVVMTNVPHLVVQHSPTGFEWGYSGSGPADLALNICEMYLRGAGSHGEKMKCFRGECFTLAWKLHQPFKRDFIATAPLEGITYPFQYVKDWFEACGVVIGRTYGSAHTEEGGSDEKVE